MVKKIRKLGNSHAIPLDKAVMELLHLHEGDEVAVTVHSGRLIIEPVSPGFTEQEIEHAAVEVFNRYAKAFKKLAE